MFVLHALFWLVLLPFRLVIALLWIPWLLLKLVFFGVLFLVVAPLVAFTVVAALIALALFG